uniref:non-ribosomal peptide synthetase n=1 Tax=Candidatus Protochlamydia sp. W-9 TaxID=1785087 RepID=UPI00096A66EF|nr:non-ribosomal peptide synthetase [Candidatus Protochlamydia sp. W-9]
MIEQDIKKKIASILEISTHEIDSEKPLTTYGIDSLKAIEIQTFIESNWQINCGFEDILNDITISNIISLISSPIKEKKELKIILPPEDLIGYSLTYQQMGIKRFDSFSADKASYNIGKAIEIHSHINEKTLEISLKKLIEIHPSLRTRFVKNDEKEEQIVDKNCSLFFKKISLSPEDNPIEYLNEFAMQTFDLSCAPLFRVLLLKIASDSYIFLVVFHHIIADLWSIGVFFYQLFQIYRSLLTGEEISFPLNPEATYEKFVDNQHEYLRSEKKEKDLNFWLETCQSGDHIVNLPYDLSRKNNIASTGRHHSFLISSSKSQKLKALAQENRTTPFVCLLAVFELFIHFYSGQTNFFIGTTVPGRLYSKWHSCLGLFANILPIKVKIGSINSFSEYVNQVKTFISAAFEHSEMPFIYLIDQLSQRKIIQRDISYSPLFQTMFVYQQVPSFEKGMNSLLINGNEDPHFVNKYGLTFRGYRWDIPVSPFDLTLYMNECEGRFQGCFEYNSALFFPSTIELASTHFNLLLDSLLENQTPSPSCMFFPIKKEVLKNQEKDKYLDKDEFEKHTLQSKFDDGRFDLISSESAALIGYKQSVRNTNPFVSTQNWQQMEFSHSFTIISLFKDQVKLYPDHIFASDNGHMLTLKKADEMSYQAAGMLVHYRIQNGTIVAVLMDHSIEMIVVLLAIMKLGAILLPLDPQMPEQRIKEILNESQAALLVTDTIQFSSLMKNVWFISLSNFLSELHYEIPTQTFIIPYLSSTIAYIIYTSGSTGKPKGIAVSHHSLVSYLTSIMQKYHLKEPSHWALHSPISFDLTLTSLFLPIVGKHTLHIFSRKIQDVFTLFQKILEHSLITHIKLTPSHLKYLKEIDLQPTSLKQLIVGGEQLPLQLVEAIWSHFNEKIQIINEYGPTEATIGTIYGIFPHKNKTFQSTMLVDQCLDNADFMICDDKINELPANLTGELFLAGTCLAYGYWNKPELTAESFIPFPRGFGKRMYKTGDLTRQLTDGSLLILGRIGRQIKIHGFRIEIEEIEQKIVEFSQVKMCTVALYDKIAKKIIENQTPDSDPTLCAYIVPHNFLDTDLLDQFLTSTLPYYMKPSRFIVCDDLPLSNNGKIDFSKLQNPEDVQKTKTASHLLPQTKLQERLAQAWSEVLRIECKDISINHHFFELGGDSINVIELIGKCKTFEFYFTPKDLYNYPTIELLSNFLEESKRSNHENISYDLNASKNYHLSPIQKRFFKTHVIDPHHYNQAVILNTKNKFDPYLVHMTLKKLINHHDILRAVFLKKNNTFTGCIQELNKASFNFEIFEEEKDDKVLHILQKKINIETGPLICAGLYRNNGQNFLLIVIHHLLIDGVSWRILLEDFDTVYSAALSNTLDQVILHKTCSYSTWVEKLYSYFSHHSQELHFWDSFKEKLPDSFYKIANRKSLHQTIFKELSDKLLTSKVNKTRQFEVNDIFLIALSQALPLVTGKDKNCILLESHGRTDFLPNLPDITRTIGWFTSLYPILLENDDHKNLADQANKIKKTIKQIPNNGIGYQLFIERMENKNHSNVSQSPSICFNYLGRFDFSNYKNFEVTPILKDIVSEKEQTLHNLEIIIYYNHDSFHLTILYDSFTFEDLKIKNFVKHYQHFLEILTDFCLEKHETNSISVDGDVELSISELNHIFSFKKQDEIEVLSPMSPMQQGMLFEETRFPGHYYIEQAFLEFRGIYDENLWKKAFAKLISQTEILRAIFLHEGLEKPRIAILKRSPLEFSTYDISNLFPEEQNQFIENYSKKDKEKAFSLSQGPLIRVTAILKGMESFLIIWSFHHIILDGWSLSLLFKSLMDNLKALLIYSEKEIKEVRLPALEYYRYLDEMNKQQAKDYYKELLSGYNEQVKLPKKASFVSLAEERDNVSTKASISDHEIKEVSFTLPKKLIEQLQSQAHHHCLTLNSLLQTAWGILIAYYSNRTDVVFGTVSSGRTLSLEKIENMVGMFIATLPVRVTFDRNNSFAKVCKNVQKQIFQTQQQINISLAEIQALSPLKQNLLDHLFLFENYPLSGKAIEIVEKNKLPFSLIKASLQEETPYHLTVTVIPGDSYYIQLKYYQKFYHSQTIEHLASNWQTILKQIANDASTRIENLACLSNEELSYLHSINKAEIKHPLSSIHSLFDSQVKLSPDSTAIVFGNSHISYQELHRRASFLSLFIQNQGFGPENLIGILMDRSIDMVVCWLAILKAGCAYVPLNVNEPMARLEEIFKETNIPLVLTHKKHHLPKDINALYLDLEWEKITQLNQKLNSAALTSSHNLAYVIYTSGSTGKPKGIAMEHASVVNHIHWLSRALSISKNDRILQCTDFSFDITICSFYSLFVGGVVVLVPQENSKNMRQISQYLKHQKITIVQLGSSLFGAMVQEEVFSSSDRLRYILCGGSPLKKDTVQNWYRIFNIPVLNLYGPTETCIDASYHQTSLKDLSCVSIPIGKPIDNYQAFILNDSLDLCPIEGQGELFIGGAGVARGYYSRPDLTAEAFLPHLTLPGKRMYKTGDLCFWNSQQEIILNGRSDHQVKIRGLRVELKEIEHVLLEIPEVKEVLVRIIGEGGNTKIIAYIVAKNSINEEFLKNNLAVKIPSHMIPSFYIFLENFPLNERQKIDIYKLPAPPQKKKYFESTIQLTIIEKELQTIWAVLLNLKTEDIYVEDNFFDLGGNSLLLMQLQTRIYKAFSKSVTLDSFFQYPSIKTYASFLQQKEDDFDLQPLIEKQNKQNQYRNARRMVHQNRQE